MEATCVWPKTMVTLSLFCGYDLKELNFVSTHGPLQRDISREIIPCWSNDSYHDKIWNIKNLMAIKELEFGEKQAACFEKNVSSSMREFVQSFEKEGT